MITEQDYAQQIVSQAPGRSVTVIELGAHHGNDTVRIYDAATKPICYVAVEADPRNIDALTRRIEHRHVSVMHAAVWDDCRDVTLNLSGANASGSSSVRQPLEHLTHFPTIPFDGKITVQAYTLDVIAALYGIEEIDLIWCDIQGAERNMIAGGRHTLDRTAWLLTECDAIEMYRGQATRDELLEILGKQWELVAEWPENANLLLRNRSVGGPGSWIRTSEP